MPDIKDEAVALEEYGLSVEDVRELMRTVRELEDEAMLEKTLSEDAERISGGAVVTLLVFVDDRCIGQKKVPLLDAEGRDGVACQLYREYGNTDGEKRKVRVIGMMNGVRFLFEPNDGTEVSNIAHYEADPDYYR